MKSESRYPYRISQCKNNNFLCRDQIVVNEFGLFFFHDQLGDMFAIAACSFYCEELRGSKERFLY